MTTAPASNRASLLAGLRTGGVRSTSGPLGNVPHTAAPTGTFSIPRFASQHHPIYPEEEEDNISDIAAQNQNFFGNHGAPRTMPMTAAVDGPNNRFSQQQGGSLRGMNPNSTPFNPSFIPNMQAQSNHVQTQANQALHMQMMQLEIMRLQAIQAHQLQSEMVAQAQRQQHSQSQTLNRRASLGFTPPATAGPLTSAFDLRSVTLNAQARRANQVEQLKSQLGINTEGQVPMTAALGGKFGSRTTSLSSNGAMSRFPEAGDDFNPPPTPGSTTVISGGTALGNPASNNANGGSVAVSGLTKSESATSWRRGGNNNSVLSGNNRSFTSPSVKVTPPPGERLSPPPNRVSPPPAASAAAPKARPQPLRFSAVVSQPLPAVAVDGSGDATDLTDFDDAYSTASSKSAGSASSPTTPHSSSSNDSVLSPREEAAKKLYEGLGIGRPALSGQTGAQPLSSVVSHRMASQPMRQPRGPPSGADELGPKNFATRIRRKAIGGLGMLMDARERREFIEAY